MFHNPPHHHLGSWGISDGVPRDEERVRNLTEKVWSRLLTTTHPQPRIHGRHTGDHAYARRVAVVYALLVDGEFPYAEITCALLSQVNAASLAGNDT